MSSDFTRVKDSISAEFDAFSNNYTEDMIKCVPYYQDILRSMVYDLPMSFSPKTILDLGCGNGNIVALMAERFPDARYTLIDASEEMLDICLKRFPNLKLNLVNTYFDDFSFSEESFDLVSAGFSLHHVDGSMKQRMFPKIYRCLKQGGIFTYGDLMISRENADHPGLILEWERFVNANYPDGEKWEWLMEHYNTFDRPDNFDDQILWLQSAQFSNVHTPWRTGYWVSMQAAK